MPTPFYIAVDFDGTIVHHEFPQIGEPLPFVWTWLKQFQDMGAKLILWTMRSGETLEDAVALCKQNEVEFYGINKNPTQRRWTDSPKAYANLYIDDAAFGCPTLPKPEGRPFVDWHVVGPKVCQMIYAHNHPK